MIPPNSKFPVHFPKGHPPVLTVVVDTEEEFDWSKPFSRENIATSSISAQRTLHDAIFDELGIIPTYVVDWPVATTAAAIAELRSLLDNKQCEIGAHLHPWVTPPHKEVVSAFNSYAGNLPRGLEFEKIRCLTQAITDNFQQPPLTFKAGRYGVGPYTMNAIEALGYKVDASIVPYTSFVSDGGPDFSGYSEHPFWFGSLDNPMLELPVTTGFCGVVRKYGSSIYPIMSKTPYKRVRIPGIAARTGILERIRLTPEGCRASEMMRLAKSLVTSGCPVLTLTYHSPSAVPGHTPYVRDKAELQRFVSDIKEFCHYFRDELGGIFMSVNELYDMLDKHKALSYARVA